MIDQPLTPSEVDEVGTQELMKRLLGRIPEFLSSFFIPSDLRLSAMVFGLFSQGESSQVENLVNLGQAMQKFKEAFHSQALAMIPAYFESRLVKPLLSLEFGVRSAKCEGARDTVKKASRRNGLEMPILCLARNSLFWHNWAFMMCLQNNCGAVILADRDQEVLFTQASAPQFPKRPKIRLDGMFTATSQT